MIMLVIFLIAALIWQLSLFFSLIFSYDPKDSRIITIRTLIDSVTIPTMKKNAKYKESEFD
jgi:hypothetical protein